MEASLARQPLGHHYLLSCPVCGGRFADPPDGFLLVCPEPHPPALLRAIYDRSRLAVHRENAGAFRYAEWLPVRRVVANAAGPVVFRAQPWARQSGWKNSS